LFFRNFEVGVNELFMTAIEIKGLHKDVKKYIDHADVRMLKAKRL
jgi:hypothetical protein